MVVEHHPRDVVQCRRLHEHVEPEPRVQLDQRSLLGRQRVRGVPLPRGEREVADGAEKRRGDDHVPPPIVEPQLLGQQTRVDRQLARLSVQHRVVRGDGLGEHAHGRAVRIAQLVFQPAVVERGTGVISERQQQLVADLLEASGAVGADDHPVKAIAQVERDGDERVDLPVSGGGFRGTGTRGSSSRKISSLASTARPKRCASALCDGSCSKPWESTTSKRTVAVVVLA